MKHCSVKNCNSTPTGLENILSKDQRLYIQHIFHSTVGGRNEKICRVYKVY